MGLPELSPQLEKVPIQRQSNAVNDAWRRAYLENS
jgi:hypothetical protein